MLSATKLNNLLFENRQIRVLACRNHVNPISTGATRKGFTRRNLSAIVGKRSNERVTLAAMEGRRAKSSSGKNVSRKVMRFIKRKTHKKRSVK